MEHLYIRHVLHSSLSLAVTDNPFTKEHNVLMWERVVVFRHPLAIKHPDCHFVLCDSIGKNQSGGTHCRTCNLTTLPCCIRAEALPQRSFQVVVSRAVTRLENSSSGAEQNHRRRPALF